MYASICTKAMPLDKSFFLRLYIMLKIALSIFEIIKGAANINNEYE